MATAIRFPDAVRCDRRAAFLQITLEGLSTANGERMSKAAIMRWMGDFIRA